MPAYQYNCASCDESFEVVCPINEYKPVVLCEFCGKSKGVQRVYENDKVYTGVKDYNTLGSLAERNTKKYGKEKCHKMQKSFKTKKKGPKKLPTMTKQDYLDMPTNSEKLRRKRKK